MLGLHDVLFWDFRGDDWRLLPSATLLLPCGSFARSASLLLLVALSLFLSLLLALSTLLVLKSRGDSASMQAAAVSEHDLAVSHEHSTLSQSAG
mmetsp:Transcript_16305/g.48899  ORF Transcript_16305/g.48899 Transcript_16305/m.48899 type:complete len:94 (-) Transcript_16305:302-583(-)